MSREVHVQFWEHVGVKLPRATHLPLYRQGVILQREAEIELSRAKSKTRQRRLRKSPATVSPPDLAGKHGNKLRPGIKSFGGQLKILLN
jgi:hypothetical protein